MPEFQNIELARNYNGAFETNSLGDTGIRHEDTTDETLDWTDPDLKEIIRIRLLSDVGFPFWDVSYVLGRTTTGEQVHVRVPFAQLPKKGYLQAMVEHAKRDGVYLKGLCFGGDIAGVVSRLQ